jgi:hypothetical protein
VTMMTLSCNRPVIGATEAVADSGNGDAEGWHGVAVFCSSFSFQPQKVHTQCRARSSPSSGAAKLILVSIAP